MFYCTVWAMPRKTAPSCGGSVIGSKASWQNWRIRSPRYGLKEKLLVGDRDRWEMAARQCESEITELRSAGPTANHDKFRLAKAVISKTLHPDNAGGGGAIARLARTEIFKEIWPEIVKIDRGEA